MNAAIQKIAVLFYNSLLAKTNIHVRAHTHTQTQCACVSGWLLLQMSSGCRMWASQAHAATCEMSFIVFFFSPQPLCFLFFYCCSVHPPTHYRNTNCWDFRGNIAAHISKWLRSDKSFHKWMGFHFFASSRPTFF